MVSFNFDIPIYLFSDGLPIGESRVLKPLTMNELMLICVLKSSSRYFYEIRCSECGAYMFTIVMPA